MSVPVNIESFTSEGFDLMSDLLEFSISCSMCFSFFFSLYPSELIMSNCQVGALADKAVTKGLEHIVFMSEVSLSRKPAK